MYRIIVIVIVLVIVINYKYFIKMNNVKNNNNTNIKYDKYDNYDKYDKNEINNNLIIEPFDGIRKNNARQIFGILLIIIIIDLGLDVLDM